MTRPRRSSRLAVAFWLAVVCAAGCKSSSGNGGAGSDAGGGEDVAPPSDAAGSGGSSASDGAAPEDARGGDPLAPDDRPPDTNGSGGAPGSGGSAMGTGGRSAAGGARGATGGTTGSGGRPATGSGGAGGGRSSTGGAAGRSGPIPVQDLPIIKEMPDPLTMNDGTKVTTEEQWRARRQEMIQILQDYEYGHIPPPPGNVVGTEVTAAHVVSAGSGSLQASHRMLHLTFGPSQQLGFDLGIFTPVGASSAPAPDSYPVLIYLTSGADDKSLGSASAALARGYAVATVGYQQLGADSTSYASTAFFPAYPDYDWRDIAAWAWGVSRAVDYLVTDPSIDASKLAITGVSRLGQAVLLAGALDERVALSAPVAAGAALRFSGKELGGGLGQGITEIVDQNTYWFGPRFADFKDQTYRLPCDQHWMPALTAPRLFIMCNSLMDQYGRAYAAAQTYLAAQPVYDFLGVSDNMGVNFRQGMHGITSEDWSAILDFSDQYLLKKGGTRTFNVLPPADQLP